jgi:hypothetical protein
MLDNASILAEVLPGSAIANRYVDLAKVKQDLARLQEGQEVSCLLLERILGACFLHSDEHICFLDHTGTLKRYGMSIKSNP